MSSLNSVTLCGRLGRDVECRFLPSGDPVANFSLATSETWTKDGQKHESTQWHRVEAFGRVAEIARDYLQKGSQVLVVGQLVYDEWTDREGQKKTTAKVKLSGPRAQLVLIGEKRAKSAPLPSDEEPHRISDEETPF